MGLKRIQEPSNHRLERILIYGDPKTGKTRLATSLTERFGNLIYFAADPGSEGLASVLQPKKGQIHIVASAPEPGKKYDPIDDAFQIAIMDWSKEYPNAKTLVWDTMTATSMAVLQHVADTGQFSQGSHIALGTPGTAGRQNIPMQGDYMATHNIISRLVDYLFRQQLHIVVVCHATYDEPRDGGSVEGGPATSGKATVRSFPGKFDSVIHLQRRTVEGKPVVEAFTERHGIWSAGIRSGHKINPMPKTVLEADPTHFWQTFDSHFTQKEVS